MPRNGKKIVGWIAGRAFAVLAAALLTLVLFLVLPLLQAIGNPLKSDMLVSGNIATIEPPEPPQAPEEEIEKEKPPPPPPELTEQAPPPLDLAQLELALNPGTIGEGIAGNFHIDIVEQLGGAAGSEEMDRIFSLSELDSRPRAIFQRSPVYPSSMRRSGRTGTVYVIFIVDTQGRVRDPKVQKSTDAGFEDAAVEAVSQWRFEPGTRKGQKVEFKMRVPITFNAG